MTLVTMDDCNRYITTIRINFENAYNTQTKEERAILLKTWYAILKEYPKEVCDMAVINALKHAKFAPRIGDITEQIEKLREAYEKSSEELWAELSGVLREVERCVYRFRFTAIQSNGATEGDNARQRVRNIFSGLSPELKEYLRDARGLIELSEYSDKDLSFEKGRFLRTLPTLRERARIRRETPEQLAGIIKGLTVHFAVDCADTKLLTGE